MLQTQIIGIMVSVYKVVTRAEVAQTKTIGGTIEHIIIMIQANIQ